MTYTIAGTYTTLVTLGAAIDNPTTITAAGLLTDGLEGSYQGLAVVNAGGIAIAGPHAAVSFTVGGSVTNLSGGTISGDYGVYAANAVVTVVNAGSIAGTAANAGAGVRFDAGGSVTNQSGGTISGRYGIFGYRNALTVVNAGSIVGSNGGIFLNAGGSITNQSGGSISGFLGIGGLVGAVTVVNAGTIAGNTGIYLQAGGSVTNQSGGLISGDMGIYAKAGTVVNAGTIIGSSDAVKFAAGFANRLVIDPNAVFAGEVTGGNPTGAAQVSTLELASAGSVGTLSGLGTQFVDFARVTVDAGAQWTLTGANTLAAGYTLVNAGSLTNAGTLSGTLTLAAGGVLSNASTGTVTVSGGTAVYGRTGGAATVVNAGVIAGSDVPGGGRGIDLAAGGSVTNQSGGSISGWDGIYGDGAAMTVMNAGSIAGDAALIGDGVALYAGGGITNQSSGVISGYRAIVGSGAAVTVVNAGSIASNGLGVVLDAGGGVTNQSGGAIIGRYGIWGDNAAVTVVNAGTITGNKVGVSLYAGGSVTNQSGGSISGVDGIVGVRAGLTVVNAGTITGSSDAVKFAAGFANRLVIDPNAVFAGEVTGGGGVLELASAASAGTLSSFGTSITNFGSLQFDPGAAWTVSGDDAASGLGTIAITGFADNDTIDLTGFVAVSDTFANNTLVLTDASGDQATLNIEGSFTAGAFQISRDGSGGSDINLLRLPGISGTAAGQAVNDDATVHPFSGVTISDSNAGSPSETVMITLTNGGSATDTDGMLSGTGLSKTGTGTYLLNASSAGAITMALDALVFTPTAHQVATGDTVTTTFTIRTTDTAGASVSDSTTTVIATAVNDPPVITGATAGRTATDDATLSPFAGVAISDVDFGQTETVTVSLSVAGNGSLSSLDGGSYDSATGIYSVTGTDAAVSSAVDGLVFTPTAHQVAPGGSVTTTFTIRATDTAGGTSSNSTTTVVATAVNDPPVISGTRAGQLMSDDQTDRPFSRVTISDPDVGASETVTITLNVDGLPSDANGTLSGAELTETGPGTGIYTLTAGTPAAVTAELQALMFTPAVLTLPPGSAAVTDMTLSVSDGIAGSPTTDTTTSVAIVPCFAAGTRIATPSGAIPVERLREGDTVLTVSGKPQPIQWIGYRTLDCNRHMSPKRVKPIRIAPHAFGENRPQRALLLSPDHSVFVEDVFIPIKHLANGTTVTQIDVVTVTYYHIELPRHDVVLAEGLPAETYLETGARFAFENGGGAMQIHPDFAPDEARVGMVWQNFSYAPLIGTDGQLDRVRARLALQALMLGHQIIGTSQRGKKRARRS